MDSMFRVFTGFGTHRTLLAVAKFGAGRSRRNYHSGIWKHRLRAVGTVGAFACFKGTRRTRSAQRRRCDRRDLVGALTVQIVGHEYIGL